jgi:hypothetical protein
VGLAFQPMAGMLYMGWYLGEQEEQLLGPRHRALIERAAAMFSRVVPVSAPRAAIMLFRVGEGPAPSATSLRRPLALEDGGRASNVR